MLYSTIGSAGEADIQVIGEIGSRLLKTISQAGKMALMDVYTCVVAISYKVYLTR